MPLSRPDTVRRRLTRRYVGGLLAMALALVVACGLVDHALGQRTADSREVNLAGRQRMLSQKIVKEALAATAGEAGASATLEADLAEWADVHRALLDGDASRRLPGLPSARARAHLDSLTDDVGRIRGGVRNLTAALAAGDTLRARRALPGLLDESRTFLVGMDRVVFALDDTYVEAMSALRRRAIGLTALLLGMLAVVARFVLSPSVRLVSEAMDKSAQQGRLLQTVIDTIPDHIYVKDIEGRATLRNLASARALGFDTPGAAVGHTDVYASASLGVPDLGETALSDDLEVVRTAEPIYNKEERSADGGWLLTTKLPLLDGGGDVVGLVGVSRDVTQARESAATFESLVEHSVAGTAIIQDDRLVYVNPRMADVFGYPADEMVGLSPLTVVHEDDAPLVAETLRRRLSGEAEGPVHAARGRCKDGRTLHIELSSVVGEFRGRPAVIATVIDVTERVELERTLFYRAHHDDLTGLPNRALFASRLEVALAERDGAFAVLFLDLDRFKSVNDTLGHAVGDRLLQEVARRLQGSLRPSDMAARLGGDEFAVLLTEPAHAGHAEEIAERIGEAFLRPIPIDGRTLSVGVSVGVVIGRPDHASPDDVLRQADLAMYDAKHHGGGHALYSPTRHRASDDPLHLEAALRRRRPAVCTEKDPSQTFTAIKR